jgi:uncharacterized membrane protein
VSKKNEKQKTAANKSVLVKIIIAASFLVVAVLLLYANPLGDTKHTGPIPKDGENLVITKSEITPKVKYFPYKTDGITMELLAIKASDGTIRTAFNTCQVCYDSGLGYFEQKGNVLICKNCGLKYPADRVGIEKGGCNPLPIMFAERIEDNTTITIPGELIVKYKDYFLKWKKS